MEPSTGTELHDKLASRKAEEFVCRRKQAVEWLKNLVGPLGISDVPSEKEFISCLRNGLILCNAINKVHPGAVSKVVNCNSHLDSLLGDIQPLPAYQYFENVKNFLVAVEELKLPAFEASDLERDTVEAGSDAKVVDCILALKGYHECVHTENRNGFYKPVRSPIRTHSSGRKNHPPLEPVEPSKCQDMHADSDKKLPMYMETDKLEEFIVKILEKHVTDTKENIDNNLTRSGTGTVLKSAFKDIIQGINVSPTHLACKRPFKDLSKYGDPKGLRASLRNSRCNHKKQVLAQQNEIQNVKALLATTKKEFGHLQSQIQRDVEEVEKHMKEISTAAIGYYRVLKENRRLYNMVQDLKGNIRVYCRIRPSSETGNAIEMIGEEGMLVLLDPSKPLKDGRKVFQFNRVFDPTATQDEVFEDTQPLIRSVMDGFNVCIFAYGQTGSGKTYTMSGPPGWSTTEMGISYLALNDLFHISNARKNLMTYDIQVQMVEIYNEQVRDLLAEDALASRLEIRSCGDNGVSLPDAKTHAVRSTADVMNLMKLGEVNRSVSSTAINSRSSRSHSIVTVHVHGRDQSGTTIRSCLHLVDLAGSERVDKSEVTGDRLREAQHINKSLSCLGDVITALAQKSSYVPYRNSKLTLLLQDSLGGNAKTLMFAHISPEMASFGETMSTLKFAQRVSTVELGTARANKETTEIMQLKEQVECLKRSLASKEINNSARCSKLRESKSPKPMFDKTPPRSRRLSSGGGGGEGNKEKPETENSKRRLKSPTGSLRSRRLSLEGSKDGRKEKLKVVSSAQSQDMEAMTASFESFVKGSHAMAANSSSPELSSHERQSWKVERKVKELRCPTTPESKLFARGDKVQIVMQGEFALSAESRTTSGVHAKGSSSHIRKSLRTIGKLINASDKRIQQESNSPLQIGGPDVKLAGARALRRQSLAGGVETLESNRLRRSSLGGKPTDSDVRVQRNVRTPPPVRSFVRNAKRWL